MLITAVIEAAEPAEYVAVISFKVEIELGEQVCTLDDVSRALFSLANQVMGDSWEELDSGHVLLDGKVVGDWRVEAAGQ